jgi:pseudouridine-5'-phosphate glycosidase
MNSFLDFSPETEKALRENRPVVALESTVISHGLPYPQNLELAMELKKTVRDNGAVPATIALLDGKIKIGLKTADLERLASPASHVHKTSRRDLAYVSASGIAGATTVSATMWAAHRAGIKIFATGGIGGVHREARTTYDISADLFELSRTPVAVVSSGVKSILDIGATLEYLETLGVPVITFGDTEFPAFFSRQSGFKSPLSVNSLNTLTQVVRKQFELEIQTGILIANPVPETKALDASYIDTIIAEALQEQKIKNIRGKEITPFLLQAIVRKSKGKSLQANIALLKNNAALAARLAKKLCEPN